jgi:hypothetical protein
VSSLFVPVIPPNVRAARAQADFEAGVMREVESIVARRQREAAAAHAIAVGKRRAYLQRHGLHGEQLQAVLDAWEAP